MANSNVRLRCTSPSHIALLWTSDMISPTQPQVRRTNQTYHKNTARIASSHRPFLNPGSMSGNLLLRAGVAELVDAQDLKSCALRGVRVRFPSPVPTKSSQKAKVKRQEMPFSLLPKSKCLPYGAACSIEPQRSRNQFFVSSATYS